MKSKRFTGMLIFTIISLPLALSQIPQGFNYQAIVHNGTGSPIVNYTLPMRITIQSDSLGGTIYWQELHSAVTTNASGVVNLAIGKGVREAASTVAFFSEVDWSVTPKFIQIEVNYNGWKLMGRSRLWSVPFSMAAGNISGPLKKLTVEGTTANLDESLFEVKNKNGQTVFAVYNEGVRIYVADGNAKGIKGGFAIGGLTEGKVSPQDYFIVNRDSIRAYIYDNPLVKPLKGGFAIGGFDDTKALTNDYLLVSPDSVRVYIDSPAKGLKGGFAIGSLSTAKASFEEYLRVTRDSTRIYINDLPGKGIKGGFAIGGFDNTKGNSSFFNVSPDATNIIDPSENRILWYPAKNAFLTGRVLIEQPDSVGENSFASGFESKAKGQYSQALGYQAIARGDFSTAIGKNAVAKNINSFAFGELARAQNSESYAIGKGAIASGFRSFAFGSAGVDSSNSVTGVAFARGDYSFSIGQGSQALGGGAFAIGLADTAKGEFSTAIGYKSSATGYLATAIGNRTRATGSVSTAFGSNTTASGQFATALGVRTEASEIGSTAMGSYTIASGMYSTSGGDHSVASQTGSTAIGWYSTASGFYSTAFGSETTASGNWSTAMGYQSKAIGVRSMATGYKTNANGDNSTAMGTMTTASGTYSFAAGINTEASGHYSTVFGDQSIASGLRSFAAGNLSTASGLTSTAIGVRANASGNYSIALGVWAVAPSYNETAIGSYNTDYTPVDISAWNAADRLFVVGNGTFGSKSNALTILKNGRLGLQTVTNPSYALELPNNSIIGIGQARAYAWATYSDDRVKTEQSPIIYGLDDVMKLTPKSYFHHNSISEDNSIEMSPDGEYDLGLIAQDVFNIIPEAVIKPENEEKELWSLSYDKLIPVLIKAIQEQQMIIQDQNSRIITLEQLSSEFELLKQRMDELEMISGNR